MKKMIFSPFQPLFVSAQTTPADEHTLTLPTQDLPNGVFFLSLMTDGVRLANTKLVIQH